MSRLVQLLVAVLIVACTVPTAALAAEPIVIDHNCTDLSLIPDYWIEQAKQLTFHYAHTSHGSQIVSGLEWIESRDPKYGVAIRTSNTAGLPTETGVLRIYDGNPPETYIEPPDYWASLDGFNRTRAVAATGDYDYSMWAWCGQQSSNTVATVNAYLTQMNSLETERPDMRFILMTGHTDGGGQVLARNNDLVRQYALDRAKVVYDFADIESWDPAGNHYPNTTEACTWCASWCDSHPADCVSPPSSCQHSHPFNCVQKGKAFWWMMARLAGWPGPGAGVAPDVSKIVAPHRALAGDVVTYTVILRGSAISTDVIAMSDVLPAGLSYVPGTLTATSGTASATQAPKLTWTGTFSPSLAVTLNYAARLIEAGARVLTNAAVVSIDGAGPVCGVAPLWANPETVSLPILTTNHR